MSGVPQITTPEGEKVPQPTDPATGRFISPYDKDTMLNIMERVANGEMISHICKEPGMPRREQVYRWAMKDPELQRALTEARIIHSHVLEEEMLDLASMLVRGDFNKDMVRAVEVAITQMRWSAGKRNPQSYSDKGPNNAAVTFTINTNLNLGQEASPGVFTYDVTPDKVEIEE